MYNTGQTAVFVKDLTGKEYPAIVEVNRKKRVNGQREISLSFLYTEINKDFIHELEFGWKVLFKDEWYTITYPGYSTDGEYIAVNVTAILSFFVDLNGYYMQDKVEDKSFTPAEYFSQVFQNTPYSFVLVDSLYANTLSYQDNQSKTERFLYGIDRFNAEYKVQGKVVYIYSLVGNDKDVILHEDLNVNSVKIDVDASGFHTWAKGFGDLPDGEDAEYQLEVEYISPLAAKYGLIEGPAIKDGNFKHADNLTKAVKNQVENSYVISTEIGTVDLTNNSYPEMILEEGDRVWLYVDRLNLNQQVRIMEVDEIFDWEGNIIDAKYIAGNEGIATRYKTQQYQSLKDFKDIINGRKRLQFNWLPEAVKRASEIINGNQDSLFKYLPGEIIGINQSNPSGYTRYNTDGLGFSRDGGKTYQSAMTYEGIVADAITTGTLNAALVRILGANGYMFMDGDKFKAIDPNNANKFIEIIAGELTASGGSINIIRPDGVPFIQDGLANLNYNVQSLEPVYQDAGVTVDGRWWRTGESQEEQICNGYTFRHEGSVLCISVCHIMGESTTASGGFYIRGFGGSESVINAAIGFSNKLEANGYETVRINIGKPTYQQMQFYLKLRTGGYGQGAYLRKLRIWQED